MSELIEALDRELKRLEAELKEDVRYRRIQRIKELLADYRAEESSIEFPQQRTRAGRLLAKIADGSSKRDRIKKAVKEYLRTKYGPVHRSEILKYLVDQKLMGGEKNPLQSLAIYLSDWRDEFEPDGQGNWALKDIHGEGHQTN